MKLWMRPLLAALVLSVAGLSMANSAHAGCGFVPSQLKPNAWNPPAQTPPRPGTYQLNHFPLAWDATGQSPANAAQLTETVKLTDRNHMTGMFTLKVYVWTSTDSLSVGPPSVPVATVTGAITATRVTVNSTVPGSTE